MIDASQSFDLEFSQRQTQMVMRLPGSWLLRQSSPNSIDWAATASKLAGFGSESLLSAAAKEDDKDPAGASFVASQWYCCQNRLL
jgi:hypothetical protein